MIIKDVIKWLLDNDYMQIVNGQLVVLRKMQDEVLPSPPEEVVKPPPIDKRAIWAKFVADCEIPHRSNTSNGSYYLRLYSAGGGMELVKIIYRKGLDYKTLVESTKNYYRSTTYAKTLTNYLRDGLWEEVYKEYLADPRPSSIGENPFEA